jgi:hypothetical protein
MTGAKIRDEEWGVNRVLKRFWRNVDEVTLLRQKGSDGSRFASLNILLRDAVTVSRS